MRIYLYLSPEKVKQYYFEVIGKQIPNELKKATGFLGSGKLNVAVVSTGVDKKRETVKTFSIFWPEYMEQLLNSSKMSRLIKDLPDSVKNISQSSLCRCVCQFSVTQFDKETEQVLVRGVLVSKKHLEIQVDLSCSYRHFSIEETASKISSYAMPFVFNKVPLELETVFLVLNTQLSDSTTYQILGSPLYIALPERKLPWKK